MTVVEARATPQGPRPDLEPEPKSNFERVLLVIFVALPFLALIAAAPMAWGLFLGWSDVAITAFFYVFTGLGVTVGFHRYFTHGSFKANRPLRIALAVAGSMAVPGSGIFWGASHRRHHP